MFAFLSTLHAGFDARRCSRWLMASSLEQNSIATTSRILGAMLEGPKGKADTLKPCRFRTSGKAIGCNKNRFFREESLDPLVQYRV
jgi:hypothetical protein